MFNLTSKIEKFCDAVLIPNATRLDAAVAYGVPVVQNKVANKLADLSQKLSTKSAAVAEKSSFDAAQGKQVFDALFGSDAKKSEPVVVKQDAVVNDAMIAMFNGLSAVEKLQLAGSQPALFAQLVKLTA